jgi:hypothetical protein
LLTLLDLRAQLLTLREQAAHLTHGAGQIRLGIGLGDFRIGGIEREQRLSRKDHLRVIHFEREHGAGHFAGDLHDVAVDVCIVGGLEVAAVQKPVAAID